MYTDRLSGRDAGMEVGGRHTHRHADKDRQIDKHVQLLYLKFGALAIFNAKHAKLTIP